MRADRLISIVMLLQTRERMTAEELSQELEVSPRTIYRDITALNIAGIPIYSDRGPGGGIALLESYRTSLTGMSEDEAKALFMMSIPQALVDLGYSQKLKSALLKLAVAMPAGQQMMQAHTQQRIYLDSTPWTQKDEPAPHIGIIHHAVWQDKLVRLVYQGNFDTQIEAEIAPLGLVAKMNTWYLVGMDRGYVRVIKIEDILRVDILDQVFTRDKDFNLATFWKEWCKASQERRSVYIVQIKVAPELFSKLHLYLGEVAKYTISDTEPVDSKGWRVVIILFENFFRARESILNFGNAAEVLEPEALKLSVIDFAKQIVDFYQTD
jgi:predicted DNA-binding transcriptional regulator YafY